MNLPDDAKRLLDGANIASLATEGSASRSFPAAISSRRDLERFALDEGPKPGLVVLLEREREGEPFVGELGNETPSRFGREPVMNPLMLQSLSDD
jgi:hypothetical protein